MYVVESKIKRMIKGKGYRMSGDLVQALDIVLIMLITKAIDWTRPKKTIDREALFGYMASKGIKL